MYDYYIIIEYKHILFYTYLPQSFSQLTLLLILACTGSESGLERTAV